MQACSRTKKNNANTNLRRLALGSQFQLVPISSLACKFELDQSECKSSQATRKALSNRVASYRKFLACDRLPLRLAKAHGRAHEESKMARSEGQAVKPSFLALEVS